MLRFATIRKCLPLFALFKTIRYSGLRYSLFAIYDFSLFALDRGIVSTILCFYACAHGTSINPEKNILPIIITVAFNNMQTLKFKAPLTHAFFATINQMCGGFSQLSTTAELNCAQQFDYCTLGSSQKLGGAAEQFIDGIENCICWLSCVSLKGAVSYLVLEPPVSLIKHLNTGYNM